MACYICGDGIESGKSFIPVDAPGTPNRRWVCTDCANLIQKQQARNELGEAGLQVSRIFDPDFLR